MPRVTLLNYADRNFRSAQRLNSRTGRDVAGFDRVLSFGPEDVDGEFRKRNQVILDVPRGGGYWLWKPYLINRTLADMPDGEWLFYCDSGSYFLSSFRPVVDYFAPLGGDIICFEDRHSEYRMTKRAVFEALGITDDEMVRSNQRLGTYLLLRASDRSRTFVSRWLELAQQPKLINDDLAEAERPDFVAHRHDQSILSLLTKLYGIEAHRDPSQFGNPVVDQYDNSPYGQLIQLTRRRDVPLRKRLKRWLAGKVALLGRSR